jgi:hypothetical protein
MITYEKVAVCPGNFWDGGCEGGREEERTQISVEKGRLTIFG